MKHFARPAVKTRPLQNAPEDGEQVARSLTECFNCPHLEDAHADYDAHVNDEGRWVASKRKCFVADCDCDNFEYVEF